jgi:putative membrane protein
MRIVISLATAAMLGLAPALAQDSEQKTQNNNQPAQTTSPAQATPNQTPGPHPQLAPTATAPDAGLPDAKQPAATETSERKPQDVAPAAGATPSGAAPSTVPPVTPSATAGFKDIGALKKDDRGVWRGQATDKSGAQVQVGVDYQGNIVAN